MSKQDIRAYIREKFVTDKEFSEVLGVSQTHLSLVLSGESPPSRQLRKAMGHHLGLSDNELSRLIQSIDSNS